MALPSPSPSRNLLLAGLSPGSRDAIVARSTPVALPVRFSLLEAHEPPQFAYFLTAGLASIVAITADGGTAEVGVMGRESLVGGLQLVGDLLAPTRCFMQLDGAGLRIPMPELRRLFQSHEDLRVGVLRQIQEQAFTTSQIAGCHRLHEAEQRLARWLLMVQDRTESDVLNLTQEAVAEMLGTRRTTVTMVAGELQRNGLIQYRRGQVCILDRPALEAAACDCYRITRDYFTQLYGPARALADAALSL